MSGEQAALRGSLEQAVARVRAPDVVFAVTRDGERTVLGGGTAVRRETPRENLRYELGSLSKTFTVLLLARLAADGVLALDDPLAAHRPDLPFTGPHARRITLRHLATHTSGLPRVPRDLLAGAVLRPHTNGYAGYGPERLAAAFAGARIRHAPGSRWHYSNFGLALLGSALERATGTRYPALLAGLVLDPLGLTATSAEVAGPGEPAATGHRADGRTAVPSTQMAAFTSAGGVRAAPGDLLGYAEAHLFPDRIPADRISPDGNPPGRVPADPAALRRALMDVQVPLLRRGLRHRHTHTLAWYQHPAAGGPLLFHAGATFGQQSFLGYHPATGTGVAAFATRYDRTSRLVTTAYALLHELCDSAAVPDRARQTGSLDAGALTAG